MRVFREQLELAEKMVKPVQVHSRGAAMECLEVLSTLRVPSVQLHWFQEESLVRGANDRGYYVSFGPALLFSKKLRRMARAWGTDRILVESDGPVGFDPLGGAGGPLLVPSVAFELARLGRSTFEETVSTLRSNGLRFLGEKA
jgi:TatD DNase family protein